MEIQGTNSYNSKYGAEGLRRRNEVPTKSAETEAKSDSFNKTKHFKKRSSGVLPAILLAAGTAVAVFFGHGKIKNGIAAIKKEGGEIASKIPEKYPNLASAGSSLKEAAKTPLGKLSKVGSAIGEKAVKIFTSIKNAVTKKA